jgi:hypothetical protein
MRKGCPPLQALRTVIPQRLLAVTHRIEDHRPTETLVTVLQVVPRKAVEATRVWVRMGGAR